MPHLSRATQALPWKKPSARFSPKVAGATPVDGAQIPDSGRFAAGCEPRPSPKVESPADRTAQPCAWCGAGSQARGTALWRLT
jgi:hypothetical protein